MHELMPMTSDQAQRMPFVTEKWNLSVSPGHLNLRNCAGDGNLTTGGVGQISSTSAVVEADAWRYLLQ